MISILLGYLIHRSPKQKGDRMCEFLSGYVLKNGDIFCDPENADSHTEMLESNKIKDNRSAYYHQNVCRWEFTPHDITKVSKLDNWSLTCDESIRPDWWAKVQDKVHTYAWQRIKGMIIENSRDTLLGGCWILDGKKAKVKKIYGGRIIAVINGASLEGAQLIGTDLHRAYLKGANLANTNFRSGATLDYANAEDAILDVASFHNAILTNVCMTSVRMKGAGIYETIISNSNFERAKMDKTRITNSILYSSDFKGSSIRGGQIAACGLDSCNFNNVDFRDATLDRLNLKFSSFGGADMRNTVFSHCDMFFDSTEIKTCNTQLIDCHTYGKTPA